MRNRADDAPGPEDPRPRAALGRPARFARADGIAAAIAILTEDGPALLSVRRVADLLGASRQVVYTLFGSQLGLVDALYQEGFLRLRARLGAVEAPPGAGRVMALAEAYRANARDNSELYGIMFERPFPRYTPSEESMALATAAFEPLAEAVAQLPGRDADPWDQALRIWATAHGIVHLQLQGYLERLKSDLNSEAEERRWFLERIAALVPGASPETGL